VVEEEGTIRNSSPNPAPNRVPQPAPPGGRPERAHDRSREPLADQRSPMTDRRDARELDPALRGMYYLG